MRLTLFGWLRYMGLVAVTMCTIFQGAVAVSLESPSDVDSDSTNVVELVDEENAGLRLATGAGESPIISDQPQQAPYASTPTLLPVDVELPVVQGTHSPGGVRPLAVELQAGSPGELPAPSVEVLSPASRGPVPGSPVTNSPVTNSPALNPGLARVKVKTASFNGIIPGSSTLEEVRENWGKAVKITKREDTLVYLYTVEPFDQVEVSVDANMVSSIVIRLDQAFPAVAVAEQLRLDEIRPVLVSNPLGEILGQAFPERGVLFAFEPGKEPSKPSMQVSQIILEPVTAEPFILRAETYLDKELQQSEADLRQAIALDPRDARARWLHARALTALGYPIEALEASAESVRLSPDDVQYRATHARLLGQAKRFDKAIDEAKAALAGSEKRPHIRAKTLCLLGDLFGSGSTPDYKSAVNHHMQAIQVAEPLSKDPHPAIRLVAQEVLVDAHLGTAHDIAWGNWNNKEVAVPKWLDRALKLAKDADVDKAQAAEFQFRVARRAMTAYVGLKGQLDPASWAEKVRLASAEVITAATDPVKKESLFRELGTTLYDAVQIYQMRQQNDLALQWGERAVKCFEQAAENEAPADAYLLGRLYFRLGAIHAINEQDHQEAVTWFEKSGLAFDRSMPHLGSTELGRLGETYVSMGVSYWETDQQKKAVQVTRQGVELIETAVDDGVLDKSVLEIPYGNLAVMERLLETAESADPPPQNARRENDMILLQ